MDAAYALARARAQIVERLARQGIASAAEEVRETEQGIDADLALPLFRAAKEKKENPHQLAEKLGGALDLSGTLLGGVSALRGYLNFALDKAAFARAVAEDFARSSGRYGSGDEGAGRTIVIDYSSPNIAKPFSVGHLRSTIIGQALHNVFTWLGYRVIGDNHLGDWGTQFGKLLAAFERWGREEDLASNPTGHLLELYVRFHAEAKENPELEREAREWFRRLEANDGRAHRVWQRFVKMSLSEFERIYRRLGVSFEQTLGESFYAPRLDGVVARALEKGAARREKPLEPVRTEGEEKVGEGETVVLIPLDRAGISTPLILQKSDGTSLYATREIACAEYRIETWKPDRLLYVVGNEQELYFRQLNAALRLLGYETPCVHVSFGLVRLPQGRMSTREGRVVLLEDVMNEAVRRARSVLTDREMTEAEKDEVAETVGIGAIKYADLSQTRVKEVVFDWDRMLALDGDSAPYLLYAHTRCRSILRKADAQVGSGRACERSDGQAAESAHRGPGTLEPWNPLPLEFALIRAIARFPDAVRAAAASHEPHRIANCLYRLAQDFSAFYNKVPVLKAEDEKLVAARLGLVRMSADVLKTGLNLLGIAVPNRM